MGHDHTNHTVSACSQHWQDAELAMTVARRCFQSWLAIAQHETPTAPPPPGTPIAPTRPCTKCCEPFPLSLRPCGSKRQAVAPGPAGNALSGFVADQRWGPVRPSECSGGVRVAWDWSIGADRFPVVLQFGLLTAVTGVGWREAAAVSPGGGVGPGG
jgi:hypothetical protein